MDSPDKPHVLMVDDNLQFLEVFSALAMAWSGDNWEIHTADNSARALAILEEQPVILAIMDIDMPVMDGRQLLKVLGQKHPHIKKVILTGHADELRRAESLREGADLFLEKPRTHDGFETIFVMLREILEARSEKGFRGVMRTLSLGEIIQMECLSRKSSILEIGTGPGRGRIFIEHGAIVHAESGPSKGNQAFYSLLGLEGGDFKMLPFDPPAVRSIDGQWEFLIMEAARAHDERSAATEAGAAPAGPAVQFQPPESATPFESREAMPAEPCYQLPGIPLRPVERPVPRILEEFLIASDSGSVQFQFKCAKPETRAKMMNQLRQKTQMLTQLLRVGEFERLEVQCATERAVLLMTVNRHLLTRVSLASGSLEIPGT